MSSYSENTKYNVALIPCSQKAGKNLFYDNIATELLKRFNARINNASNGFENTLQTNALFFQKNPLNNNKLNISLYSKNMESPQAYMLTIDMTNKEQLKNAEENLRHIELIEKTTGEQKRTPVVLVGVGQKPDNFNSTTLIDKFKSLNIYYKRFSNQPKETKACSLLKKCVNMIEEENKYQFKKLEKKATKIVNNQKRGEEILKDFFSRRSQIMKNETKWLLSVTKPFRSSKISNIDSLGKIIEHAQTANNRSRKVFIQLGLMNNQGELTGTEDNRDAMRLALDTHIRQINFDFK